MTPNIVLLGTESIRSLRNIPAYAQGHAGGIVTDFWGYRVSNPSNPYQMANCFVPQHTIALALGAAAQDTSYPEGVHNLTLGPQCRLYQRPRTMPF